MKLLSYEKKDDQQIRALFIKVFSDSAGDAEGKTVGRLVSDMMEGTESDDILGFVAKENAELIGSIFFTRMFFGLGVDAFILSPVAVHTRYQGQGVGKNLITFGLDHLKAQGAQLVFTYGDPNYYLNVGFQCVSEEVFKAPFPLSQPEGWLCQTLDGSEMTPVTERPRCVDALSYPEYW